MVERANGYLETSTLSRRGFADLANSNTQPAAWVVLVKNDARVHGVIRRRPLDAASEERAATGLLPPRARPLVAWTV